MVCALQFDVQSDVLAPELEVVQDLHNFPNREITQHAHDLGVALRKQLVHESLQSATCQLWQEATGIGAPAPSAVQLLQGVAAMALTATASRRR